MHSELLIAELLVAVLALLTSYVWVKARRLNKKYAHIPGPSQLPLLGSFHLINKLQPFKTFEKWGKDYGPVSKMNILGRVYVVANDYETVNEVLNSKGNEFAGRPHTYSTDLLVMNTGLIRLDKNKKWKALRRISLNSIKAFGKGMSRLEEIAILMSEGLTTSIADANCKPLDPFEFLRMTTIRMITLMALGKNKIGRASCRERV